VRADQLEGASSDYRVEPEH